MKAFSFTCPAAMQIYWNKRKFLLEEEVQLPQDQHGPYFIILGHQNGGRDVMRKHSDYKLNCSLLLSWKSWAHNRLEAILPLRKSCMKAYTAVRSWTSRRVFVFLNCLTKTLTEKKTFSISHSFVYTDSVNFFGAVFKLNFPWRTLNYTELNPINLDCG